MPDSPSLKELQAMQERAIFFERMARMKLAVGARTDKDLASYLGISQPSVAGAVKRGQLPPAWVIAVSEQAKVSADWILYGRGRMELDKAGRDYRVSEPVASTRDDNVKVTVIKSKEDLDNSGLNITDGDSDDEDWDDNIRGSTRFKESEPASNQDCQFEASILGDAFRDWMRSIIGDSDYWGWFKVEIFRRFPEFQKWYDEGED